MSDNEILHSDEFVKFSQALTTPLTMQVSDLNNLYNKKNKDLRSELKKDWFILNTILTHRFRGQIYCFYTYLKIYVK